MEAAFHGYVGAVNAWLRLDSRLDLKKMDSRPVLDLAKGQGHTAIADVLSLVRLGRPYPQAEVASSDLDPDLDPQHKSEPHLDPFRARPSVPRYPTRG